MGGKCTYWSLPGQCVLYWQLQNQRCAIANSNTFYHLRLGGVAGVACEASSIVSTWRSWMGCLRTIMLSDANAMIHDPTRLLQTPQLSIYGGSNEMDESRGAQLATSLACPVHHLPDSNAPASFMRWAQGPCPTHFWRSSFQALQRHVAAVRRTSGCQARCTRFGKLYP